MEALRLRLTFEDSFGGTTVVDTDTPVVLDNTANAPPVVSNVALVSPGVASGNVAVAYAVSDAESDPVELVVEYLLDDAWLPASAAPRGDGIEALPTLPTPIAYTFI